MNGFSSLEPEEFGYGPVEPFHDEILGEGDWTADQLGEPLAEVDRSQAVSGEVETAAEAAPALAGEVAPEQEVGLEMQAGPDALSGQSGQSGQRAEADSEDEYWARAGGARQVEAESERPAEDAQEFVSSAQAAPLEDQRRREADRELEIRREQEAQRVEQERQVAEQAQRAAEREQQIVQQAAEQERAAERELEVQREQEAQQAEHERQAAEQAQREQQIAEQEQQAAAAQAAEREQLAAAEQAEAQQQAAELERQEAAEQAQRAAELEREAAEQAEQTAALKRQAAAEEQRAAEAQQAAAKQAAAEQAQQAAAEAQSTRPPELVVPPPSGPVAIPGVGVVGGDAPAVDVPPGSIEEAMRAEQERPRPRPQKSAAFQALHDWCRARTKIVPSGFTIQVQVLDPAAPSYRFDLEPPDVDDPQYGADKLSELLGDLWLAESQEEQGGWLFARIDTAGRTMRVDRWYDQVPDWWDSPVEARLDVHGLVRRLNDRGPDWQPSYLEKLYTTAR